MIADFLTREHPHGTRARYNSQKCRCFECRRANTAYEAQRQRDPRIDAEPVRQHLAALSAQGVGLRAVSDATDIARPALMRVRLGARSMKRSLVEKILAVDEQAIADHSYVDAADTQRLLRELITEGYPRTRIAKLLGSQARVPALHYKQGRVIAKTAMRVRKLHAALLAEGEDITTVPVGTREQVLSALQWFDEVTAEDLFDAMGIEDRDAHTQMLHRLWKAGEVERVGERKPFRYRSKS